MRDLVTWNFHLGCWAGIHVRLHAFFLLLVVVGVEWVRREAAEAFGAFAFTALVMLLASVVLHEVGHFAVARRLGPTSDQMVLWPFGGLVAANLVHEPRIEMATAVAGPLVNLIVALVVVPPVLLSGQGELLSVNPLRPPVPAAGLDWATGLALLAWINLLLVYVNLLPALPLDGGRFLQAALRQRLGYRTAVLRVALLARLTGLGLLAAGLYLHTAYPYAWLPFALVGIFLFFSARNETGKLSEQDAEDAPFGYDFSQGYTSLERAIDPPARPRLSRLRQWLLERRRQREVRRRQLEEEEDRRVDAVLGRLHEGGADALTAEERALLKRVSARYRSRQGR